MPTNDTALSANTQPGPTAATTNPPIAGPTARATFMLSPFSAAACGNRPRSTRSGWIACQAGLATALPQPRANVSARISAGEAAPAKVVAASAAAARNIANCAPSSSRRRSTRSAQAPAGSASATIGRLDAVCTSETSSGDRSTSSHCAPTVCIHVPTLEANCAIHSARKTGCRRSGAHADTGGTGAGAGFAAAAPCPPASSRAVTSSAVPHPGEIAQAQAAVRRARSP